MQKWFNSLSRVAQIILLVIPVVNWVVEILVRWSAWKNQRGVIRLVLAIVVTVGGAIVGWVDFVWCIIFRHMIFSDAK